MIRLGLFLALVSCLFCVAWVHSSLLLVEVQDDGTPPFGSIPEPPKHQQHAPAPFDFVRPLDPDANHSHELHNHNHTNDHTRMASVLDVVEDAPPEVPSPSTNTNTNTTTPTSVKAAPNFVVPKVNRVMQQKYAHYRLFGRFRNLGNDGGQSSSSPILDVEDQLFQRLTMSLYNSSHQTQTSHEQESTIAAILSSLNLTKSSYAYQLWESTRPDLDQPSAAYGPLQFTHGFTNQLMAFTGVCMTAYNQNITQLVLPSLHWLDLFGSNVGRPHQKLFNVLHWNRHYAASSSVNTTTNRTKRPRLPRLVHWHPSMIDLQVWPEPKWTVQLSNSSSFQPSNDTDNTNNKKDVLSHATKPYAIGRSDQKQFFFLYRRYRFREAARQQKKQQHSQQHSTNGMVRDRHPSDQAILEGALRPRPELVQLIRHHHHHHHWRMPSNRTGDSWQSSRKGSTSPTTDHKDGEKDQHHDAKQDQGYLCLHARIEPDMQAHTMCPEHKVLELSHIVDMMYRQWPHGPPLGVTRVLVVLNRRLLEQHAARHPNQYLAKPNLDLLNTLVQHGMWNGTVPVVEAGGSVLPPAKPVSSYKGHGKLKRKFGGATTYVSLSVSSSVSSSSSSLAGSISPLWYSRNAWGIASSMIDYQLALDATVLIGTPVSSFSMQAMAARFHQSLLQQPQPHENNTRENFLYYPSGLWKIPPHQEPPVFEC